MADSTNPLDEYRMLAEQMKLEKAQPCPACGHCPTCGRSASPYPYWPQVVPYWPSPTVPWPGDRWVWISNTNGTHTYTHRSPNA